MNTKDERRWALDYVNESTKIVVATISEEKWYVRIDQKSVSDEWSSEDRISLESFKNYDKIFVSENGVIEMWMNTKDYVIGSMAVILVNNDSKDDFKPLYINFSDNGKVIVGSEKMKESFGIMAELYDFEVRSSDFDYFKNEIPGIYHNPPEKSVSSQLIQSKEQQEVIHSTNVTWSTTTNANTEFRIYRPDGTLAPEYSSLHTKSPFKAIHKIVEDGKTNYTVRESTNTSKIVFKYEPNDKTKFYCFQFTNFYGCVGVASVNEWTTGYLYTHVVRSDGYFGSNTNNINPDASNQPYSHSYSYQLNNPAISHLNNLEGNSGAYVYKISKATTKTKATMIVNLSETTLHYSSDTNTTFYCYIGVTSNGGQWFHADIGLAMSRDAGGKMQFVAYPSENSTIQWSTPIDPNYPRTIIQFNQSGTTYTTEKDVKLYVEVINGCFHGKVYNYWTAQSLEVWIYNSKIKTTNQTYMNGTSLVPVSSIPSGSSQQVIIPDIRCGAYASTVPILYPRLYTSAQSWDGSGTEFTPISSSITDTLIIYDNDHATHSYNSSNKREVINIDYTNNYEV